MPLKLSYIHDPDKNYRVRLCMRVADSILHTESSVKDSCDECDEAVWVDMDQPVPDLPDGLVCDGDIKMCFQCFAVHSVLSKKDTDDEPIMLPPLDYVRKAKVVPTTEEDRS